MKFSMIRSYAKVNLSLNVTGKKNSKLHKIESLVTFIGLHDLIYLKKIESNSHKIYFTGKFKNGINKNNTISHLLKILDNQKLLMNQKFEIKIIKNIPQESGMGGGSMNASSLINYFIKKKILKLTKKKLINLANIIGSDVILGFSNQNTVLSSNGSLKVFKKKINFHVLVTKPNFGCSTKLIYSKVKNFSKSKYNKPSESLFKKNNILNSSNELEKIAFLIYPKIKKLKLYLSKIPNVIFCRMSGSGSTMVSYFNSKEATVIASRAFKRKFKNYWCITSKTI